MQDTIAQIAGLFSAILITIAISSKNIKRILIIELLTNFVMALVYFCLSGLSGFGICIIATVQTYIFYKFQSSNRNIPVSLIIGFLALYIAICVVTYKAVIDIIPLVCVIFFALAIMQKKPSKYRFLKTFNAMLWIIYDGFVMAYTTIFTHGIVFFSALIAIIKIDLRKKDKN